MKKSTISALTVALIVGSASATFAAENPFSDVPAGHWAYNSVSTLASEGVIEGYGDGTFLGDRNITRYEMAQMVAKAMAKNPQGASKAELEKLAAEFRDELDSLGVRVAELEKHSDMVKWTGELRYRYWSIREEQKAGSQKKTNTDQLQLRLFPTAEINDHWNVKARLTASHNMNTDSSGDVKLTYAYAEGNYKNFKVNIGKMPLYSLVDDGLVVDDFFSGIQVTAGDKFKARVEAGRWNLNNATGGISGNLTNDFAANYQGVELSYDDKNRFYGGVAYRHFSSKDFADALGYDKKGKADDANIISVGASYKFGSSVKLAAAYAHNSEADDYNKAYNVQLNYKGANKQKGSWGAFVAYRYAGSNAALIPTYDVHPYNKKGIDIGLNWSPFKNTLTQIDYFGGKSLETDQNVKTIFGRVSFFF